MTFEIVRPQSESYTEEIEASAGGYTTVVSAVAGKKIRVVCLDLSVNAAVEISWYSDTTRICPPQYFAAGGGLAWMRGVIQDYRMETAAGEALRIFLGGAAGVGGMVTYELI